jgi:hypothetical protein
MCSSLEQAHNILGSSDARSHAVFDIGFTKAKGESKVK